MMLRVRWLLALSVPAALLACPKAEQSGTKPSEVPASAGPSPEAFKGPPADASRTPSKLAFKILRPGDGETKPGPRDEVEIHYSGWNADGSAIFSTSQMGRPAKGTVQQLFPGLSEGLQLISTGARVRLWIPQALAEEGSEGPVVYDVELVGVVRGVGAPADVSAPPTAALKTGSGLAYVVLSKAEAGARPGAADKVTVHYTGWTTDGQMFDSSRTKGEPATLPLSAVIPGWKEGLQLMQVGEHYRFWVPEPLAYQGRRKPHGMLVFDVELIAVN